LRAVCLPNPDFRGQSRVSACKVFHLHGLRVSYWFWAKEKPRFWAGASGLCTSSILRDWGGEKCHCFGIYFFGGKSCCLLYLCGSLPGFSTGMGVDRFLGSFGILWRSVGNAGILPLRQAQGQNDRGRGGVGARSDLGFVGCWRLIGGWAPRSVALRALSIPTLRVAKGYPELVSRLADSRFPIRPWNFCGDSGSCLSFRSPASQWRWHNRGLR
jgi:hypothetical protein